MASPNWTRLIRFVARETGRIHIGQPTDAHIDVGLAMLSKQPLTAHEISGTSALDASQVTDNVLTVDRLLEPIAREQIGILRCLGLNYTDHAAEAKMPIPPIPNLFYKPITTIIPPGAPIVIPRVAQPVEEHVPDYEVELAIVIGKVARDVPEDKALEYVLGYTAGNDVSFRKYQLAVSQWCFSKSFDNTTPIGPCLVSTRQIPDPQNLSLTTMLNGKVLQDGTTANQIFSVKQTVAFLSQGTTLLPGAVIITGTPKGVGFVRDPPILLRHGDDLRIFVGGGIGTLVSPVIEEKTLTAKI